MPPLTCNGALVMKKVYRPIAWHLSLSVSRSHISPIGVPVINQQRILASFNQQRTPMYKQPFVQTPALLKLRRPRFERHSVSDNSGEMLTI
jgi:hypothetical protein